MRTFENNENHEMTITDFLGHKADDIVIPIMAVIGATAFFSHKNNMPLLEISSWSIAGLLAYLGYLFISSLISYVYKKILDLIMPWLFDKATRVWFAFQVWLRKKL